jgi:Protein of unknown function (DUF992)
MLAAGVAGLKASAEEASGPHPAWEIGILTCSVGQESKAAPEQGQGREVLCRFRQGARGPEESYAGTLRLIDHAKAMDQVRTIMFVVRGPAQKKPVPGLLQQSYAAEAAGAPDRQGPLTGQRTGVVLRLASEDEGQPSMALGKGSRAIIMIVELTLQAAAA